VILMEFECKKCENKYTKSFGNFNCPNCKSKDFWVIDTKKGIFINFTLRLLGVGLILLGFMFLFLPLLIGGGFLFAAQLGLCVGYFLVGIPVSIWQLFILSKRTKPE